MWSIVSQGESVNSRINQANGYLWPAGIAPPFGWRKVLSAAHPNSREQYLLYVFYLIRPFVPYVYVEQY